MSENEIRELIRDFLNGEYTEEELALKFDLEKCNICESYEFQEELIDTTEQDGIGYICENCIIDVE